MPIPPWIKKTARSDQFTDPWSTRVTKGLSQFLYEIKSDFALEKKSEVLRFCVLFTFTWIKEIAEREGHELGEKLAALIENQKAKQEYTERKDMMARLYDTLVDAEQTDHPALKARLLASAERLAKAYGLPWPLPDLPFLSRDSEARYLVDRIASLLSKSERGRITLRELQRGSKFNADETVLVLSRLEVEGFIVTETETRSGPKTIWITLPSLQIENRARM